MNQSPLFPTWSGISQRFLGDVFIHTDIVSYDVVYALIILCAIKYFLEISYALAWFDSLSIWSAYLAFCAQTYSSNVSFANYSVIGWLRN